MVGGGYFANFGALALFGFEVAVSLLQERSLVHGALGPTFASEQKDERVKRDAQVERERGVLHIPIVERAFFFVCYKIAAVDIRRNVLLAG